MRTIATASERCSTVAAVVDRLGPGRGQPLALDQLEDRRHHQRRGGEHQHRGLDAGAGAAEGLFLAPDPARQHRRAEDEQDVADDRADDRGLDHLLQALAEREEGDDQLRRVAEGDVEQAADPRPRARRQLLGRAPHQRRRGDDPQRRGGEDDGRRSAREVERDGDRDQRRQQVGPALRGAQEGRVEPRPVGVPAWFTVGQAYAERRRAPPGDALRKADGAERYWTRLAHFCRSAGVCAPLRHSGRPAGCRARRAADRRRSRRRGRAAASDPFEQAAEAFAAAAALRAVRSG